MSLGYILSPQAEDDYNSAFDYYDAIDDELSGEFVANVAAAFARISTHPRVGHEIHPSVRRVLVKKFPYAVIYREVAGGLQVISVFHTSRDPADWQSRV